MIVHNQRHGIEDTPEDTEQRFRERNHKHANILAPLDIQLTWLETIGFHQTACYLKVFELAVFGGIRPHDGS